ncbi:MAG TPA: alkane 1-monooxygenase [Paracoccaceae bacterium]|nr:alkane 1-monooxygenase [Paracoccaceae bacterium]
MPQPIPLRLAPALFAAASLAPAGLVAAGALAGGAWVWGALLSITFVAATLDRIAPVAGPEAPEGDEFPASDGLLLAIAAVHAVLLPLAAWAVAGPSDLTPAERAGLFTAAGLWFGQVVNPAAHELIHRPGRALFRLGAALYATLLFGHHASAHRLVHHRHAASRDDPNTARAGEGFWRFLLRAWAGSFREGWRAEAARPRRGPHPYAWYLAGSLAALALAFALAGWPGVLAWTGLAVHAQTQLLLSDYVQHYGLTRRAGPDGRPEPMALRHSWNAPHWFTGAMMLNAPRHSDHHAHPARPYPALRLFAADEAPRLPWALPVACFIALVPPWWRRAMAPHLAPWRS